MINETPNNIVARYPSATKIHGTTRITIVVDVFCRLNRKNTSARLAWLTVRLKLNASVFDMSNVWRSYSFVSIIFFFFFLFLRQIGSLLFLSRWIVVFHEPHFGFVLSVESIYERDTERVSMDCVIFLYGLCM